SPRRMYTSPLPTPRVRPGARRRARPTYTLRPPMVPLDPRHGYEEIMQNAAVHSPEGSMRISRVPRLATLLTWTLIAAACGSDESDPAGPIPADLAGTWTASGTCSACEFTFR